MVKAIDLIWTSFDKEEMRRGFQMLMHAARQGDADALCIIARCFMGPQYVWSGGGFETDDENASMLMQKSALMGSASGVLCAVRSGNFTPAVRRGMPFASFKEAFDEVREQADRGNAFCCYMIGNVYFWGDYLMVEPELADKFENEDEYNAFAYPIARAYYERSFNGRVCMGWGNYVDIKKSGLCEIPEETYEAYFRALAGVSPGLCNDYGLHIEYDKGDAETAIKYYVAAAQRGEIKAMYNAALCYENGDGVEKDLDMAFNFYEVAAIGGHPASQFQVGYYYFDGWGSVEVDYGKAAGWFEKAYENPDCEQQERSAAYLGICYQDGLGVVQDDERAFELLLEAEAGIDELWNPINGMVLNALGVACAYGRGTETDIDAGIEYFERAAQLGNEEAKKHLAYLRAAD